MWALEMCFLFSLKNTGFLCVVLPVAELPLQTRLRFLNLYTKKQKSLLNERGSIEKYSTLKCSVLLECVFLANLFQCSLLSPSSRFPFADQSTPVNYLQIFVSAILATFFKEILEQDLLFMLLLRAGQSLWVGDSHLYCIKKAFIFDNNYFSSTSHLNMSSHCQKSCSRQNFPNSEPLA